MSHLDDLLAYSASRVPATDFPRDLVADARNELAAFRAAIATARGWLVASVNANKMVLTRFTQEGEAQKSALELMTKPVELFDKDMIDLLGSQYRDALEKKP